MVKKGNTEVPVAAIRPYRAGYSASPIAEELAGRGIADIRFMKRNCFPQRVNINNIIEGMVRVPVDAAYTPAFRTDYRCVPLHKQTQAFHYFGYVTGKTSHRCAAVFMIPEYVVDVFFAA
jgi:hypothetical protein